MSGKPYGKDVRNEIVKLHLEQKRTIASLSEEYGISSSTISRWIIAQRNMKSRERCDRRKGRRST